MFALRIGLFAFSSRPFRQSASTNRWYLTRGIWADEQVDTLIELQLNRFSERGYPPKFIRIRCMLAIPILKAVLI